jgi:hypothetical protein
MNEIQWKGWGGIATAAPPQHKEAPAGRHGAISGKEIYDKYKKSQLEAIRFAKIALSLSEFEEWVHKMEVLHEAQ